MAGADKLYTPELLGLAVALADYPADPALPLHGEARSKSCGSTLAADIALGATGRRHPAKLMKLAGAVSIAGVRRLLVVRPVLHLVGKIRTRHMREIFADVDGILIR